MEERQKQHARLLVAAIGESLMKKLKEKDEQIQRMGKLNLALQERVKSLYVENQLWRNLAQTNEATANSLRTNLEQILAHVSDERLSASGFAGAAPRVEDEAESCCGSNDHLQLDIKEEANQETSSELRTVMGTEQGGMRKLASEAQENKDNIGNNNNWICRICGERESCVLLLPCRHLCLCTVCGSHPHQNCPVCNGTMNATLHVNLSSWSTMSSSNLHPPIQYIPNKKEKKNTLERIEALGVHSDEKTLV